MAEPNHHVTVTCKSLVTPLAKVGHRECQLTTFDLPYVAFYYNQKLLLYNGCDDHEGKVRKLKEGLGVVLEEFHQLAGRLGKDEDGVFKVVYDDDVEGSGGVEVVEAVCDDLAVEDLTKEEGTASFKDLIPYKEVLNVEGLHRPLLSVQLTKLKDGLAMGLAFNHAILDGTSTWHFMSAWAQACTGSPSVSVPPFLDRSKARNTRVHLDLSLPAQPNGEAQPQGPPKLTERLFKFSQTAIDKIKSTVNENRSDGPESKPFSTFQSLSVHIWRHVTKARDLKPEDVTVFTVFADCRRRVDPPMPEAYFGNLIQAIFTGTAAGLLLAHAPSFGASVIQKAIESHDARAIDARNEEWERSPRIFQFKDAGANCVAVGSSPRFKVYDIDFGWGPPESVRSGGNNRFDGMMYLYQGRDGGRSIDVEISLAPEVMERLQKDPEFLVEG